MSFSFTNNIRWFFVAAVCSISVHLSAQLTANFSGTPLSGCPPLNVSFSDLSTGGPTGWNWSFPGGSPASSTLQNPSSFYVSPGTYAVSLTITNGANSDTKTVSNYVVVYDKPQAGFTMSNDTACLGQTVTFTDATTLSAGGPPIGTWAWNFGDGFSTSVAIPTTSHAYTTPGTYPVSLVATDINGCNDNIIKNIVVLPKPTLSFSATPTSACAPPLIVTFNNGSVSVGQTSYTWNFGDGTTATGVSPTHTYTATGTYNVTMYLNQNGCIDSLVKPNSIVIQKIVASYTATPTTICSGNSIQFTNTSVPAPSSASWDFGDAGTSSLISPSHIYSTAGTYTVTMIASDASGCKDTVTSTVTVNQTPVANFIADTMVACSVPFTVTFTNTSTGATNYLWNFGDGSSTSSVPNPSHTYTATGSFNVTLVAANAAGPCIDSITKNLFIVIAPPVAGFVQPPDSGCVPLTINFASTSVSVIDPIATYIWSFGDGSTAIAAPPLSHTYTAAGTYTPVLIIQTLNGCSDTSICTGCVKAGTKPVSKFGILQDTVCYGKPVMFSDSSSGATGWLWTFGDGQFSSAQNPPHIYPDTGTYKTFLIAFNNGCADTSLIQNVVILPPKAIFSYSLSCTNYYTVQFFNNSHGADSLVWKFGDGAIDSSNAQNPSHTYPVRGPFTVTLVCYNYATGCSDSTMSGFTIAEPIASYSTAVTSGCYPFIVNLTSTSQDAITWQWNLGDPSSILDTSITNSATYTYTNTGQYPVTLIISDLNGCKDTLKDTLGALGPYPYFVADTLTGCRPLIVTFADTSVSDSVLTQWIWNFGDGSPPDTTTNDSIVHTYTLTGSFNVTMTVRDSNGCVKTIVKNNYIVPTFPFPSFTVDTFACKNDVLVYDASATTPLAGQTYDWNFGDGNLFSTNNPITTHAYITDGYYTVSLTVTDLNGCDSTITKKVRILKPTADFSWKVDTVLCGSMQVSFTDLSTGMLPPTTYSWGFGNGGSAVIQNPIAFYTTGGVFSVTLTITNGGGCKDTMVKDSIIAVPFAAGTFSISPAAGCNPLTACFDATAINTTGYIWGFGDGVSDTIIGGDTCHTYTKPGTFNPLLFLQYTLPNGGTCIEQAINLTGPVVVSNVINVPLTGIPGLSGTQPTYTITVPQDSIIAVTAWPTGGVQPYTFVWSPDTGINCDTCTSILIVGTGDTIMYVFTIRDTAGCLGYDTLWVLSEPCFEANLIPNVFSPNADGKNDIFYIPGVCSDEKYSVHIYDRWGTLMFATTLRHNGWDGRSSSGVDATAGVYYYVVEVADEVYKGFVHLLR